MSSKTPSNGSNGAPPAAATAAAEETHILLRRGLGAIFVVTGLTYCATMVLATLFSLGKLPGLFIDQGAWRNLYKANWNFMAYGGILYLAISFWRRRTFHYQPVGDLALGVGLYLALFAASAYLLVNRMVHPWTSLIPGAIVTLYGASLCAGRQVWSWFSRR